MAQRIAITNPESIDVVLDFIHDSWFDVEDIRFDPQTEELGIRFRRESTSHKRVVRNLWFAKKVTIPIHECFLKIRHVITYEIKDSANVGSYDFNQLTFDERNNLITITGGVPINIEIRVKAFEVIVEETDTVIAQRRTVSVFDC